MHRGGLTADGRPQRSRRFGGYRPGRHRIQRSDAAPPLLPAAANSAVHSPVANLIEAPGVRWVEPRHVAEIAYREYVPGRWLRHTSFKGLRESADPALIQLPECA